MGPLFTDMCLNSESFCHLGDKLKAPSFIATHFATLSLKSTEFRRELNVLKFHAKQNGLSSISISNMVRKKKVANSLNSNTSFPREILKTRRRRRIAVPYPGRYTARLSEDSKILQFPPCILQPLN